MKNKGLESVLWSWEPNGIEDNFENRVAMMFCGFWNHSYGDHFSKNINRTNKDSFYGPPRMPVLDINQLLTQNSPNKISKELVRFASKDKSLKDFNHQTVRSETENVEVLSKFDIEVLHNHRNLICDQFKVIILDLEVIKNWSSYYLCRFAGA